MIDKNEEPKVCLIYTGGTIGMIRDTDGVLRPTKDPVDLIKIAPELEKYRYDKIELLNKDSTNIIPDDWSIIAQEIYNRRNDGYTGFVVAHGTDTMHFSASAVAFALGKNLNFPVVFTGAQTAPFVTHGDARINLLRAFKVARTDIAEVVICFGDFVFRGCRAQKKDERRFDAFGAPAHFPLAYITEDILVSEFANKRELKPQDIILKNEFSSGIFQVSLIPGFEPSLLEPIIDDQKCNGIVLQSFGAGNVPDYDIFSWESTIKKATECGKPVLITSQFPASATLHSAYAPGIAAIKAGAIPTGNMTSACAAVKFRWVLAQTHSIDEKEQKLQKIYEMMNTNYIGEFDIENTTL